jgi:hypothetical protein
MQSDLNDILKKVIDHHMSTTVGANESESGAHHYALLFRHGELQWREKEGHWDKLHTKE